MLLSSSYRPSFSLLCKTLEVRHHCSSYSCMRVSLFDSSIVYQRCQYSYFTFSFSGFCATQVGRGILDSSCSSLRFHFTSEKTRRDGEIYSNACFSSFCNYGHAGTTTTTEVLKETEFSAAGKQTKVITSNVGGKEPCVSDRNAQYAAQSSNTLKSKPENDVHGRRSRIEALSVALPAYAGKRIPNLSSESSHLVLTSKGFVVGRERHEALLELIKHIEIVREKQQNDDKRLKAVYSEEQHNVDADKKSEKQNEIADLDGTKNSNVSENIEVADSLKQNGCSNDEDIDANLEKVINMIIPRGRSSTDDEVRINLAYKNGGLSENNNKKYTNENNKNKTKLTSSVNSNFKGSSDNGVENEKVQKVSFNAENKFSFNFNLDATPDNKEGKGKEQDQVLVGKDKTIGQEDTWLCPSCLFQNCNAHKKCAICMVEPSAGRAMNVIPERCVANRRAAVVRKIADATSSSDGKNEFEAMFFPKLLSSLNVSLNTNLQHKSVSYQIPSESVQEQFKFRFPQVLNRYGHWKCNYCSFINNNAAQSTCAHCGKKNAFSFIGKSSKQHGGATCAIRLRESLFGFDTTPFELRPVTVNHGDKGDETHVDSSSSSTHDISCSKSCEYYRNRHVLRTQFVQRYVGMVEKQCPSCPSSETKSPYSDFNSQSAPPVKKSAVQYCYPLWDCVHCTRLRENEKQQADGDINSNLSKEILLNKFKNVMRSTSILLDEAVCPVCYDNAASLAAGAVKKLPDLSCHVDEQGCATCDIRLQEGTTAIRSDAAKNNNSTDDINNRHPSVNNKSSDKNSNKSVSTSEKSLAGFSDGSVSSDLSHNMFSSIYSFLSSESFRRISGDCPFCYASSQRVGYPCSFCGNIVYPVLMCRHCHLITVPKFVHSIPLMKPLWAHWGTKKEEETVNENHSKKAKETSNKVLTSTCTHDSNSAGSLELENKNSIKFSVNDNIVNTDVNTDTAESENEICPNKLVTNTVFSDSIDIFFNTKNSAFFFSHLPASISSLVTSIVSLLGDYNINYRPATNKTVCDTRAVCQRCLGDIHTLVAPRETRDILHHLSEETQSVLYKVLNSVREFYNKNSNINFTEEMVKSQQIKDNQFALSKSPLLMGRTNSVSSRTVDLHFECNSKDASNRHENSLLKSNSDELLNKSYEGLHATLRKHKKDAERLRSEWENLLCEKLPKCTTCGTAVVTSPCYVCGSLILSDMWGPWACMFNGKINVRISKSEEHEGVKENCSKSGSFGNKASLKRQGQADSQKVQSFPEPLDYSLSVVFGCRNVNIASQKLCISCRMPRAGTFVLDNSLIKALCSSQEVIDRFGENRVKVEINSCDDSTVYTDDVAKIRKILDVDTFCYRPIFMSFKNNYTTNMNITRSDEDNSDRIRSLTEESANKYPAKKTHLSSKSINYATQVSVKDCPDYTLGEVIEPTSISKIKKRLSVVVFRQEEELPTVLLTLKPFADLGNGESKLKKTKALTLSANNTIPSPEVFNTTNCLSVALNGQGRFGFRSVVIPKLWQCPGCLNWETLKADQNDLKKKIKRSFTNLFAVKGCRLNSINNNDQNSIEQLDCENNVLNEFNFLTNEDEVNLSENETLSLTPHEESKGDPSESLVLSSDSIFSKNYASRNRHTTIKQVCPRANCNFARTFELSPPLLHTTSLHPLTSFYPPHNLDSNTHSEHDFDSGLSNTVCGKYESSQSEKRFSLWCARCACLSPVGPKGLCAGCYNKFLINGASAVGKSLLLGLNDDEDFKNDRKGNKIRRRRFRLKHRRNHTTPAEHIRQLEIKDEIENGTNEANLGEFSDDLTDNLVHNINKSNKKQQTTASGGVEDTFLEECFSLNLGELPYTVFDREVYKMAIQANMKDKDDPEYTEIKFSNIKSKLEDYMDDSFKLMEIPKHKSKKIKRKNQMN